uniref:Putative secreted protein n=1 Tax=Ixodes ricinus TaxID=34613 RepID=A0A6B0U1W2_IXORI
MCKKLQSATCCTKMSFLLNIVLNLALACVLRASTRGISVLGEVAYVGEHPRISAMGPENMLGVLLVDL